MNARLSTSFCCYYSACTNIFVHSSRRCDLSSTLSSSWNGVNISLIVIAMIIHAIINALASEPAKQLVSGHVTFVQYEIDKPFNWRDVLTVSFSLLHGRDIPVVSARCSLTECPELSGQVQLSVVNATHVADCTVTRLSNDRRWLWGWRA